MWEYLWFVHSMARANLNENKRITQKLDVILKNKVVQKLEFSKNVNNRKCAAKIIFFYEKKKLERFG